MRNLKNKNVIITGGASGIGYATALLLLEEQCNVMIAGKSEDGLDKALSKLPSHAKNRCHTVACDISVIAEVEKLATNSRSKFGSIDFLFANAGIGIFKPFLEITEEDFEQVINTNLTGTFFTIQKLLPLIRDGGSIIITASWTQLKGVSSNSAYSATKAALVSLTKDLAAELAKRSIRVNCISPGYINTTQFNEQQLGKEKAIRKKKQVPNGRFGTTEEIARVVAFLASDEASYINGQEIVIDGGLTTVMTE